MVFSDVCLCKAAAEDVPAMYYVCFRFLERRQSVGGRGRGAALWHPGGGCPKKARPLLGCLVKLRIADALIEFCIV